jgi:hypothetical protein
MECQGDVWAHQERVTNPVFLISQVRLVNDFGWKNEPTKVQISIH